MASVAQPSTPIAPPAYARKAKSAKSHIVPRKNNRYNFMGAPIYSLRHRLEMCISAGVTPSDKVNYVLVPAESQIMVVLRLHQYEIGIDVSMITVIDGKFRLHVLFVLRIINKLVQAEIDRRHAAHFQPRYVQVDDA